MILLDKDNVEGHKAEEKSGKTLLFNIFINDIIPQFQEANSTPPSLEGVHIGCLLYADDLVILSTTPEGLQHNLDKLAIYNFTYLNGNLK